MIARSSPDDKPKGVKLSADLDPERVTAIVDSREQLPLCLDPLKTRVEGLCSGDYSLAGLEHIVRVERKSLEDFVACCGRERERFERELQRLLSFPSRLVVIESTWHELSEGDWRSEVKPNTVTGSLLGWQSAGIPFLLCGSHTEASRAVTRFLMIVAKRRWRELRELAKAAEVCE